MEIQESEWILSWQPSLMFKWGCTKDMCCQEEEDEEDMVDAG